MRKEYFVDERSIVRRIWGSADSVLFIFAGAAAEFALNKAVDWLYFTGRIPSDPLGRLFSTVNYAKAIIFSEKQQALRTIDAMSAIHGKVESERGMKIPDWAYRDVLYLLIDYSIRSYEILERKLSAEEKEEVFRVFYRVGNRMGLKGLPSFYESWLVMRDDHLNENLSYSSYTADLFSRYRHHLGAIRYWILLEVQKFVTPPRVGALLNFGKKSLLYPVLIVYKWSKIVQLDRLLLKMILPAEYQQQVDTINVKHESTSRGDSTHSKISYAHS